jgi:hypothetical protein
VCLCSFCVLSHLNIYRFTLLLLSPIFVCYSLYFMLYWCLGGGVVMYLSIIISVAALQILFSTPLLLALLWYCSVEAWFCSFSSLALRTVHLLSHVFVQTLMFDCVPLSGFLFSALCTALSALFDALLRRAIRRSSRNPSISVLCASLKSYIWRLLCVSFHFWLKYLCNSMCWLFFFVSYFLFVCLSCFILFAYFITLSCWW